MNAPRAESTADRRRRPVDVDTGFWLWLTALPVMTTTYVVNVLAAPTVKHSVMLFSAMGVIVAVLWALVVTFLILMRSGYRWARTVLTGGGVAAVVYAVTSLFEPDARTAVAMLSAVAGIVGSVLVAGGTLLLHRNDAQSFFTR